MICAVVYDFHRTLALPPGGTIWRRSLLAELPGADVDPVELGRVLEAGFPWAEPEVRRAHGSQEAARRFFVDLLAAAAIAGGAPARIAHEAAERAYDRVTHPTESNELYPETLEVLQAVHERGVRQVVLSNHVWELPEICAQLGLMPPLAAVISSARIGAEKPHPLAYRAAIEAAGCRASEILFVGDTYEADVAGPERCGMQALLVRRPHASAARFADDLRGVLDVLSDYDHPR